MIPRWSEIGWEVAMFVLVIGVALILGVFIANMLNSLAAPCNALLMNKTTYGIYLWDNASKTCVLLQNMTGMVTRI